MSLFDDLNRRETRPRYENEGTFRYLNSSARPGISAIRDLLDSWFHHIPVNARADLQGRFRSGDEIQHASAFFELYWHELLRLTGYDVNLHPPVPNAATNPDFLAIRGEEAAFYVEATLAVPVGHDPESERRIAEAYATLDRMNSPDFFWEIQHRGSPTGNIRGRALRDRLERWAATLNYDEISRLYAAQRFSEVPNLNWQEGEFILTLTPIPKSDQLRGQEGVRPLGVKMYGGFQWIATADDIREAVDAKASKYGDPERPLVVTVNVLQDFFDDTDILDALFGKEQIAVRQEGGHWVHNQSRAYDGLWRGPHGPRNRFVSAVAITGQLTPSTLRARNVILIHNPWAIYPLVLNSLPLQSLTVYPEAGQIQRHVGQSAAEILAIPAPWPIPD